MYRDCTIPVHPLTVNKNWHDTVDMILHLDTSIPQTLLESSAEMLDARFYSKGSHIVFITRSSVKTEPETLTPYVKNRWESDTDIQLSSRHYHPDTRTIDLGHAVIGGNSGNTVMIAGPCAVESREQIEASCRMLTSLGIRTLRAGCFKPRTSPYTYRGMGIKGLELLKEMKARYGMTIVTEARDSSNIDSVMETADVIQIGTRTMYDYTLLEACGKTDKPVLLKRNYGTTLHEFLQCAEFIMSCGNENVILCERGIRTFETATRFTLDLCGVAWLKQHSSLPVIADPSHAMGLAYGIPDLARACTAMGVDGLMIETHPSPQTARSDARQQLDHDTFRTLCRSLQSVATAVNHNIV